MPDFLQHVEADLQAIREKGLFKKERLLEKGIYVIGFFYPVVPEGQARIRVQISAAHSRDDLQQAVAAFAEVRDEALI
jgi:7-keto-8-aminopelargonate synthetase-like enzyme